ncbi:alanine racemase [Leifsonia sp. NPDC080035]|uniref:Alanine racemase n=1 Tax=Leifsonia sp. NPDC080035 TaxID=3143936 RepID=A0AAU7GJ19_9MICO
MSVRTASRHRTTLTVDPAAITANAALFAERVPVPMLAVVKSDGYGHGAVTVARAALAAGAASLGVVGLDAAAELRAAGLTAPILSWMNPDGLDGARAVELGAALAVCSVDQLREAARPGAGVAVHLQLDTGLARDGAPREEWQALADEAAALEARGAVRVEGVMSHLASADVPGHPATRAAVVRFRRGVEVVEAAGCRPRWLHLAATSAALNDPATHGTLVRIGAGLVGAELSGRTRLRPAMRLRTTLIEARDAAAGTAVGYGGTWVAEAPTRLGLLPLGYADGLPRIHAGEAFVTVNGTRRRVVGVVSMNATVVDLGDTGAAVGDDVVVLGDDLLGEPTATDWARWAGTVPQDVLTAVGTAGRASRTVEETR